MTQVRVTDIELLKGPMPHSLEFRYTKSPESFYYPVGSRVILGLKHDIKNDDYEIVEIAKANKANLSLAREV